MEWGGGGWICVRPPPARLSHSALSLMVCVGGVCVCARACCVLRRAPARVWLVCVCSTSAGVLCVCVCVRSYAFAANGFYARVCVCVCVLLCTRFLLTMDAGRGRAHCMRTNTHVHNMICGAHSHTVERTNGRNNHSDIFLPFPESVLSGCRRTEIIISHSMSLGLVAYNVEHQSTHTRTHTHRICPRNRAHKHTHTQTVSQSVTH